MGSVLSDTRIGSKQVQHSLSSMISVSVCQWMSCSIFNVHFQKKKTKQFSAWNLFKSHFQLKHVTAFRTPIYSTRMHLVQQVLKWNQDLSVFSDETSHLFIPQTFILSGWVMKAMSPVCQRSQCILRAVSSQMRASHYCWTQFISRWTSRWC